MAKIEGDSGLDIEGTLYFPNNLVDLGGGGYAVGNQLIAASLNIHTSGALIINYDGRNRAPGSRSFLVE